MLMNTQHQSTILKATKATAITDKETIQNLWSGYGEIIRYTLQGSKISSVIVKQVQLPQAVTHPRGWSTSLSHTRKLKSYQVESYWYQHFANQCTEKCRIPECYGVIFEGEEVLMILEDLDASGFPLRFSEVSLTEIKSCLSWLAHFHATFMQTDPEGLWETGTYWHLDTRPDELEAMTDLSLKNAASKIDKSLQKTHYKTFVHGDAKLANFCFSEKTHQVAAVDFQYVGGGCGMKDVAYFIGSCLQEEDCATYEQELLQYYFDVLVQVCKEKKPAIDTQQLVQDWTQLYPIAWTDFHRFLKGWSPDHWKINSYSEKISRQVLQNLSTLPL